MKHMEKQVYTLGIDIGSTTVKIAILDEAHNIIFSDYKRHFANIRETLRDLLKEAYKEYGELTVSLRHFLF
jgi:activator of 2-hydroxyglutaryl-CoA dehydratase